MSKGSLNCSICNELVENTEIAYSVDKVEVNLETPPVVIVKQCAIGLICKTCWTKLVRKEC